MPTRHFGAALVDRVVTAAVGWELSTTIGNDRER